MSSPTPPGRPGGCREAPRLGRPGPRSAPESSPRTRRRSALRTTTPSTTTLPLAMAAFEADWIVTPRVLEAELGPLDAKGRVRRTSAIRQALASSSAMVETVALYLVGTSGGLKEVAAASFRLRTHPPSAAWWYVGLARLRRLL